MVEFLAALESVDAPFMQVRSPGLTPAQVDARAAALFPAKWVESIDDAIYDWYGWQNGVDDALRRAREPSAGAWDRCRFISPDGCGLAGIDSMIHPRWNLFDEHGTRYWHFGPDAPRWLSVHLADESIFPIGVANRGNNSHFLRKPFPGDNWTVWEYTPNYGFGPLLTSHRGPGEAAPPTFTEWLAALTTAIRNGRATVVDGGAIAVPPETDPDDRRLQNYPWLPRHQLPR